MRIMLQQLADQCKNLNVVGMEFARNYTSMLVSTATAILTTILTTILTMGLWRLVPCRSRCTMSSMGSRTRLCPR